MDKQLMNDVVAMVLAVNEAGDAGIPNGHLYAILMGRFSFDAYSTRLAIAKRAGWLEESGFLLTVSPKGKEVCDLVNKELAKRGA